MSASFAELSAIVGLFKHISLSEEIVPPSSSVRHGEFHQKYMPRKLVRPVLVLAH